MKTMPVAINCWIELGVERLPIPVPVLRVLWTNGVDAAARQLMREREWAEKPITLSMAYDAISILKGE